MSGPRVLLVDDRVAVRLTIKSILDDFDCDFAEADDGETALAHMAAMPFDVIFLDLKLPDLSGIETFRLARERGGQLGRVIVLTGFLEPEAKEETARLGAFRHLTKDPIDHHVVREAFVAALAQAGGPHAALAAADAALPLPRPRTWPSAAERRDTRPRILVLDNQRHWLDTIERVLGDAYSVTKTADPNEAYRHARRTHFDALILDMNLPGGITGLDVLARMASTSPDLKAIILVGAAAMAYEVVMASGQRGTHSIVLKTQLATLPGKLTEILNEPVATQSAFLSYDRRDKRAVQRLCTRLKKGGLRPWMDTEDLIVGTHWYSNIERRIRESNHFIFCHSRHSWDKEGMIRRELNLAIDRLSEFQEDMHYLIVARLDDTEVSGVLHRFACVDLFQLGGFNNLLRVISGEAEPRKRGNHGPAQDFGG